MPLNHPQTILPPQSVEKLSSMERVPGAKMVGKRCHSGLMRLIFTYIVDFLRN